MNFKHNQGEGRPPAGKKRGSLSQKDFSRWEDEHRQKIGRKGDDEKREIDRVKRCVSLAVKGALCLLLGIIGICTWPFFCSTSRSETSRIFYVLPFALIALTGVIIVIIAGIKFLASKSGDAP
jgi:hypothetical protein